MTSHRPSIALASLRESQHPSIALFRDIAEEMTDALADSFADELSVPVIGPKTLRSTDLTKPLPTPYPPGGRTTRRAAPEPHGIHTNFG